VNSVTFEDLFLVPLRNGVSYSSDRRGRGVPMVNMGEAFRFDRITDQECERVPLTGDEQKRFLLDEGDLLFVRQSLKFEGAGKCIYVGPGKEPRTWESHLIRVHLDTHKADPRYYYYYFRSARGRISIESIIEQVAAAGIRGTDLRKLEVPYPLLEDQVKIADILSALDDKISINDRIADTSREFALAQFRAAQESADAVDVDLISVIELLNRGVAPRYTMDRSQLRVLNQKCIRDGRVSIAPSRWTLSGKVPSSKMLRPYDVLVNSTGMGTLGRVARWTGQEACTVDSHVTIVRFDPAKIDPICAGFAMLDAETEIESLGQGSTGQTELGRAQLSSLLITVPSKERAAKLRPLLEALENRGDSALEESLSLAQLRDTLLPKLMSGEIRVRDAEKVVEEVT
jgi:type I restriction enzyme S subunit